VVYKITIKHTVEERILALQEKKRELAKQTIEGGKGGAGKLGMKEIMQLFRRDAEHDHTNPHGATKYDLASKPRILKEVGSSQQSSRETTASRERTPVYEKPEKAKKEDSVYGRRW